MEVDHPENYNSPSVSSNLQDKEKSPTELLGTMGPLRPPLSLPLDY